MLHEICFHLKQILTSKNGICCVVPSIYMIIKQILRGKIIAFENPFSHNSVAFEFKEYFL